MKKTIKFFSLIAAFVLAGFGSTVWADDATPAATAAATPAAVATPAVTFDGFVDSYYTYNFTNGTYGLGNGPVYFNNTDNTFSVGEAELDVTATQGAGKGYLALVAGNPNLGLNPGVDILQAYVAYTGGEMTFTGGRFVTWMGNEVIESKSNWNYSRSLLFQYTIPLWHNGVSVAWAPTNSVFGLTGYATSGDNGVTGFGGQATGGFMATLKPSSVWNFTLNGIAGPTSAAVSNLSSVGELIIAYTPSSTWSFALDSEYGMQNTGGTIPTGTSPSFWGVALYGKCQISSDWDAALRLEDLSSNGEIADSAVPGGILGTTTNAAQLQEATLTLEKDLTPNLTVRWEGRYDTNSYMSAAQAIYNADLSTSQVTGSMSAMYTF